MSGFWDVLCNSKELSTIANLCGIICFPITIVQIFKIKSKASKTNKMIQNFVELNRSSIMQFIGDILRSQNKEIQDFTRQSDARGTSKKSIEAWCKQISTELNNCVYNLPNDMKEMEKDIIDAIKSLDEYVLSRDKESLKTASNKLYQAIDKIKKVKDDQHTKNIKAIVGDYSRGT